MKIVIYPKWVYKETMRWHMAFQSHFKSISIILVTQILKSPKGCTPETSSCNVPLHSVVSPHEVKEKAQSSKLFALATVFQTKKNDMT